MKLRWLQRSRDVRKLTTTNTGHVFETAHYKENDLPILQVYNSADGCWDDVPTEEEHESLDFY